MTKKDRFDKVIGFFEKTMPVAETELHYSDPYQLLVAVILSAQCTDKRVNMVTPSFFKAFHNPSVLAASLPEDVFPLIRSISYPNNKSKHLVGMANVLMNEFKGVIPNDVELLQKMPGVGRKTANVIASVVFNKPALAVDTHVFRVSARLGLTTNARTPLQTEIQLMKFVPLNKVPIFHHWIILHGRYVCLARTPRCNECGLQNVCKFFLENDKKSRTKIKKAKKTASKKI